MDTKNLWINDTIDSSLPIDKYSKQVNYWIQCVEDSKTLYMDAKLLQKVHREVLASGLYTDACTECG